MENSENLEKCPEYIRGNAKEDYFFKNKLVFCSKKICPYNKEIPVSFDGEKITFCKSKGLLKKIELENPDKSKKENKSQVISESKFDGKFHSSQYFKLK